MELIVSRIAMLVFFSVLALLVQQGNTAICYGFEGAAYKNNTICTGSNACCGAGATCLSNRLCKNPGQAAEQFVRGPCAVSPYDPNTCADICLYNETTGFLPRVNTCSDGSLCCDGFPNCCEVGQGVFLNDLGQTIARPSSTTSSPSSSLLPAIAVSTTSAATISSTSGSITSGTNSAQTSTNTPSAQGLGTGAKIGLGVGISFGILLLAGLTAIIIIQQRRLKKEKQTLYSDLPPQYPKQQTSELPATNIYPSRSPIPVAELYGDAR